MKINTIIVLLFFLAFISNLVQAQVPRQYSICSGATVRITTTNYFPDETFLWQQMESGTWKNLTSNKEYLDFSLNTDVVRNEEIRCILSSSTGTYDTQYFKVKVIPKPIIVKISTDQLCIGKLSHFDFTANTAIVSQTWKFNQTDSFLYKTATLPLTSAGKLQISLKVTNEAGCQGMKDTSFTIPAVPYVTIQREQTIQAQYYYEKVACGNDSTVFIYNSQGPASTLLKWKVFYLGNVIFEKGTDGTLVKLDQKYIRKASLTTNKLSVVWISQTTASEFTVEASYTTSSGCSYASNIPIIVLPQSSPEKGLIFQKPSNSQILIFKPLNKDSDSLLNYQWGYTVNTEDINAGTNRFYHQFPSLEANNKYWVETYFTSSRECRSRTYFNALKPKSVTVQDETLKVYPNPARNQINIDLAGIGKGTLYMLDIYGGKLREISVGSSGKISWDISNLNPGNYLIVFDDQNGILLSEKLSITF
jgi:hypothetical protein